MRLARELIKNALMPFFMLAILIYGYIYYKINIYHLMSEQTQQDMNKYIATIFIIFISFFVQRIAVGSLRWYGENIAAKTETETDDKLVMLLAKTLKIVIWIISFVIILPLYGVNISALVATLGVGSLAIALAAKDTISNVIAGFLILVDSPFKIGDCIKIPSGEVVTVVNIGVRRSWFLSEDKESIIIVPNVSLSNNKIINYTSAKKV